MTSVSISGNAPTVGYAGVGKTITLSYNASEILSSTSATMANRSAAITTLNTTNYLANITVVVGDLQGVTQFLINFVDRAGNPATANTTTDSTSVIIGMS